MFRVRWQTHEQPFCTVATKKVATSGGAAAAVALLDPK